MRRALAAIGIAAGSAACSLFVDLGGLNDSDDAGSLAADGSFSDVIISEDAAAPTDSSVVKDSGVPFSCASIDATFCDDFNRDAALASAVWSGALTGPGCHLRAGGTLVTNVDPVPDQNGYPCFLYSVLGPNGSHFALDFDVTMATADAAASPGIDIAEVDNNLGSVNTDGVLSQSFQLLAEGNGFTKIGLIEYYPDAAASPDPGNSFPYWGLTGNEQPFIIPSTLCHVHLVVDTVTPSATATSKCEGAPTYSLPSVDMGAPAGFSAKPNVNLGFDNTGVISPAWLVTYDNMVFRSAP